MGLCNSPDIFQEKMYELFEDFEYVRVYIDDLLVIINDSYEDHLNKLDKVLQKLQKAGLKVNANKSFFAKTELEYLGYWITREGIMPVPKKIKAISNIAIPKNKKQLRRFIGMINYYRDMFQRRSEILAPLTALTSKNAKWEWTEEHTIAFNKIKKIITREVLLGYPNFNEIFDIHTDASKTQLGAVISQNGKPIAFYSRKLNPAQTRYTTTERELLAIVETLKEFKNILIGQRIRVYTDHKNLTYANFNTDRVMRWRLILEEFGPTLIYVKGTNNAAADAMSRLELVENNVNDNQSDIPSIHQMSDCFGLDEDDLEKLPFTYNSLLRHQQNDQALLRKYSEETCEYTINTFLGAGTARKLICYKDKIVVPEILQIPLVK